ncbi:MAG: hypothetical protein ACRC6L_03725 [Steroidobacteraceae bacterium]
MNLGFTTACDGVDMLQALQNLRCDASAGQLDELQRHIERYCGHHYQANDCHDPSPP